MTVAGAPQAAAPAIVAREAAVLWPTYRRPAVEFVRGSGVRLWDAEGREYLDFLGGIAVVAAGHAHPTVVAAVTRQLGRLGHTSNLYFTGPQVELAERLVGHYGAPAKVFFSNSGAEANEAAIKVARRWGRATKGDDAIGIVATDGAFHGRTLATLAATGKPAMHPPFAPLPGGFTHVPFGDAGALRSAVGAQTAAVLVEPIQGEAGIRVPPPGYLAAAKRIAEDAGALLLADEVQSGMGRTGTFFAFEQAEVRPDVVTMAKALGNGFPIGATIAAEAVASLLVPGDHGSTFGGNPAACAAALATIEVIEPLLGGHVEKAGAHLASGLGELAAGIAGASVRGLGLWQALELARPEAGAVAAGALAEGLVVNPVTPTALRLAPPLVVSIDEIDEALRRLDAALDLVRGAAPA